MRELDTQIRDYFEAIAPPFEVGDLVRDRDVTLIEPTPTPERRAARWPAVAAAVLTLVAIGLLPWLLRDGDRQSTTAATRGTLEITRDTVLEVDHIGIITVTADGVTLDCAGRTVTAPTGAEAAGPAITVHAVRDVEVRNCVVTGFDHGIAVTGSQDVAVARNTVEAIIGGVGVADSTRIEIAENLVTGASVDAYLFQNMSDSAVRNNRATDSLVGFSFEFGSMGNVVESNEARGGSTGFELADATGNTLRDNTAVAATGWAFDDRSGPPGGPTLNEYDNNRCGGAPSTPSSLCER